MSGRDNLAWLTALLGHLRQHLHLAPITTNASIGEQVQLYPTGRGQHSHLAVLADWAGTLGDPQPIKITHVNVQDRTAHLKLTGRMADGTEITVVALPDPDETDLLAAHTTLKRGAMFPVELLHQLVAVATGGGAR